MIQMLWMVQKCHSSGPSKENWVGMSFEGQTRCQAHEPKDGICSEGIFLVLREGCKPKGRRWHSHPDAQGHTSALPEHHSLLCAPFARDQCKH